MEAEGGERGASSGRMLGPDALRSPASMPVASKRPAPPVVLVLMGVSGSGKTTVAQIIAERLGWPFEEGDALHPPANVAKMAAGHPLTDEDRAPWLARVADWVDARLDAGESGVITCSALKRKYRELIDRRGKGVEFVYLHGERALIAARLATRHGHFMPSSLLDSQFATLEEPAADEPAIRVEIGAAPAAIATEVIAALGLAA
jgi:carbohydrate kinase (thermoresistant glucokinase family)